jgi:hypothetical protein
MLTKVRPQLFSDFLTIEANTTDKGCSTTIIDFISDKQEWTTVAIHASSLPTADAYRDGSFLVISFGEDTKAFLSPTQANALVWELTSALEKS